MKMRIVPEQDSEAMWSGLARDIVMWRDLRDPTGRALHDHLCRKGEPAPDWLKVLVPPINHVVAKGAVAGAIYRAMLDAAPSAGRASREAVERVARGICERETVRQYGLSYPGQAISPESLRAIVERFWQQHVPSAEATIRDLGLEMEDADGPAG